MESSLRFCVDGLGFTIKRRWIPEGDEHYPSENGASVAFMCEDSLAFYRDFKSRGVQPRNRPPWEMVCGLCLSLILMAIAWNFRFLPMPRKEASLYLVCGATNAVFSRRQKSVRTRDSS